MNDDQVDGLNSSTYWRDRNEQESREKRIESKKMMREVMKWWDEKEKWDEFVRSYPQRFAITIHRASVMGKVECLSDTNLFRFDVDGTHVELGVALPNLPEWATKDNFEKVESTFNS